MSPTGPSPLYGNFSRYLTKAPSLKAYHPSPQRCSGSIPCSIRSGTIRSSKDSARTSSREPARFRSAVDSNGRTIWIADAHRGNGKRFVVHAEEKLTAFLELKSAIRPCGIGLTSRRDFFKSDLLPKKRNGYHQVRELRGKRGEPR